jgi:uncharacterized protein (TIGR03435 family)
VILWAYDVKDYQLIGVPDWDPKGMISGPQGLYAIEAKASNPTSDDMCKHMVQALLKDRFKLATHAEAREIPVYALMVAKKGPHMERASESTGKTGVRFVVNGRLPRG